MDEQKAQIPDSFKDEIKVHYSLRKILRSTAFVSGALHGFCDSQDITLNKTLEDLLIYGPTLAYVGSGIVSSKLGVDKTITSSDLYKKSSKIDKKIQIFGAYLSGVSFDCLIGAAYTTLDYGFGYTTGKALDYFF